MDFKNQSISELLAILSSSYKFEKRRNLRKILFCLKDDRNTFVINVILKKVLGQH
jgi:hypothetical protein